MIKITQRPGGELLLQWLETQDTLTFESKDDFDWALATSNLSHSQIGGLAMLAGEACWFGSAIGLRDQMIVAAR